jgi:hypothetical protein
MRDRTRKMEDLRIGQVIWSMSFIRTLALQVLRYWSMMGWRKSMLYSKVPLPLCSFPSTDKICSCMPKMVIERVLGPGYYNES